MLAGGLFPQKAATQLHMSPLVLPRARWNITEHPGTHTWYPRWYSKMYILHVVFSFAIFCNGLTKSWQGVTWISNPARWINCQRGIGRSWWNLGWCTGSNGLSSRPFWVILLSAKGLKHDSWTTPACMPEFVTLTSCDAEQIACLGPETSAKMKQRQCLPLPGVVWFSAHVNRGVQFAGLHMQLTYCNLLRLYGDMSLHFGLNS